MPDLKRVEQFVGMLGSEHDGERANAARFLEKMAVAEKKTMVEFFRTAFGGSGGERVIYRDRVVEKTVYRDRPVAPEPRQPPEPNPEGDRVRRASESNLGNHRKAYGYGSMTGKIRTALSTHFTKLSEYEREFLRSLIEKTDRGIDVTPKQRKVLSEIFTKVGM